jgi:hypothetical protein
MSNAILFTGTVILSTPGISMINSYYKSQKMTLDASTKLKIYYKSFSNKPHQMFNSGQTYITTVIFNQGATHHMEF